MLYKQQEPKRIDKDDYYRLNAHADRRSIIEYLTRVNTREVQIEELVSILHENTGRDHRDCELELHHRHLPMFEQFNVLTYEIDDSKVIVNQDRITAFNPEKHPR